MYNINTYFSIWFYEIAIKNYKNTHAEKTIDFFHDSFSYSIIYKYNIHIHNW